MLIQKLPRKNVTALRVLLIIGLIHNDSILPQFWVLALSFSVKLDKFSISWNIVELIHGPGVILGLKFLTNEVYVISISAQKVGW